jgi:hypothetical protein
MLDVGCWMPDAILNDELLMSPDIHPVTMFSGL